MAATAKKKAKKASTKTAPRKAAKTKAAKKPAAKPKGGKADKRGPQQMLVDDAFPERNEKIERLMMDFREAVAEEKSAIAEAKDNTKTAYAALKQEVRANGLDVYYSYESRDKVLLKAKDATLELKPCKKNEASPASSRPKE